MFQRITKLSNRQSFFLFGPRGTGKSTLIQERFTKTKTLWIDLLNDEEEQRYRRNPQELSAILATQKYDWVVIDEVQKLPKLLDVVHAEIYRKTAKFVLTGSSARKLKHGAANLLAGRAFTFHLHPLTFLELKEQFKLKDALSWGSLPQLFQLESDEEKQEFLRAYVSTYLKEEIISEQFIRKIEPFRDFLPIAAQTNGTIVNFSKIANDIGADDKTVYRYFEILEDTLIGFFLRPYHRSIRKQQREAPKFYLFDCGVKRAMEGTLRLEVLPQTYLFGYAFEHLVIVEALRLNDYFRSDYKFSYLRTKDDAEIDLIIERPGEPTVLVEIKSSTQVNEKDATILSRFADDWGEEVYPMIWSLDKKEKIYGKCRAVHWQDGLKWIGLAR